MERLLVVYGSFRHPIHAHLIRCLIKTTLQAEPHRKKATVFAFIHSAPPWLRVRSFAGMDRMVKRSQKKASSLTTDVGPFPKRGPRERRSGGKKGLWADPKL